MRACPASLIAQRRKPDETLLVDDSSTARSSDVEASEAGLGYDFVRDLRQKCWEGLLIALNFTAVLPWLQIRLHIKSQKGLQILCFPVTSWGDPRRRLEFHSFLLVKCSP